jgi:hypothetical protein
MTLSMLFGSPAREHIFSPIRKGVQYMDFTESFREFAEKRVLHHGAYRAHGEIIKKNSVFSVFSVVSFFK